MPTKLVIRLSLVLCGMTAGVTRLSLPQKALAQSIVELKARGGETLSLRPRLVIANTGVPDTYFSDIRGVLVLSDGTIAAAEGATPMIMVYSPAGSFLRRIGRDGEGPGEYREPRLVRSIAGDSLLVFDLQNRRITVFSSGGVVGRMERLLKVRGSVFEPLALGSDGSAILRVETHAPPQNNVRYRSVSNSIVRYDLGTGESVEMTTFPGGILHPRGFLFFGWRGAAAATDSSVWFGSGNEPLVTELTSSGLARTYRWEYRQKEVTSEDRKVALAALEGQHLYPGMGSRDRFADTVPVFGRILTDPQGGVWLVGYELPYGAARSAFHVNPKNQTISEILLPDGFRPTWIGRETVAGILYDALGVPMPALFSRTK